MPNTWLFHNSHLPLYRSPFGAASCNTKINLRLAVSQNSPIDKVLVRTWRERCGEELIPMLPEGFAEGRAIYTATLVTPDTPGIIWYYFIVHSGGAIHYYGNNPREQGGVGTEYLDSPLSYQITVHLPGAVTPDWFKNAIVYQIFVDRFFNGNPDGRIMNSKEGSLLHSHWENAPVYVRERETGRILAYDFFGGNLQGVIAKLPYLKDLGISAIYLNPIFESPSNHKYDTADYKNIDPMFGSNAIFTEFCARAREMGIAVILDGVFSHTGSDSVYFNKEGRYPEIGAYQSPESPYYAWYRFKKYPTEYESWWGVDALPNVNEMEPSYRDFIIHNRDSVVKHWLNMGAKGWRLDVADELPDQFIREVRQAMKETDVDSVLIGEVWEDASRKVSYSELRGYLYGDELDSATNYPFRRIALDFVLGRRVAEDTQKELMSICENYPCQNFYAALNVIGSHDVSRILTLLGGHEDMPDLPYSQQLKRRLTPDEHQIATARLKLLALWQMTFPGVPCIYYGDEAGLEGYADPLNRRTFPWGREDETLVNWYRKIITLRNSYGVIRTGGWQSLAPHPDVYGYVRMTENGKDIFGQAQDNNTAVILLNRSQEELTVELDLSRWCTGMLFDVLNDEHEVAIGDGRVTLTLRPLEGKVLLAQLTGQEKECGVLLHPTSLPSRHGIGGLGAEAGKFIDFLADAGQNYWQILPLNPVGYGDSPYQSVSAFAAESLLIDIDFLLLEGLLEESEVAAARQVHGIELLSESKVDFTRVKAYKEELFRLAFRRFAAASPADAYLVYVADNEYWLPDYALYMALAGHFGDIAWNNWTEDIAGREEQALEHYRNLLADEITYYYFLQYTFQRQWRKLKEYAKCKGISIIGDLPIFVAFNSADVWAGRQLFKLDDQGTPTDVAGVPPDYFSETGQLWGNPIYRWEEMSKDDYRWWRARFSHLLELVDIIRIDHFRGFEACWEVPATEKTAENGRWVTGPGEQFFTSIERYLGHLPVIAEDLGVITPAVTELRQRFDYPGMKVLHFCFPEGCSGKTEPLGIGRETIVYTGTHDNDTTLGWYQERLRAGDTACIDKYLGITTKNDDQDIPRRLVELAYQSKGSIAMIPLQDLLGLAEDARMNTPGTVGGNWQWRCRAECLTPQLAREIGALAAKHRRGTTGK